MTTKKQEQWEEVKTPWIKWGKEGDHVFGTLISVRDVPNSLKDGSPLQKVYEIKADGGEFHNIEDGSVDKEPTEINPGEIWNIGGKVGLDNSMRNIKLGSKVKIEYKETKPAKQKGYNPLKIIAAFTNGQIDQEWLDEKEKEDDKWDELS